MIFCHSILSMAENHYRQVIICHTDYLPVEKHIRSSRSSSCICETEPKMQPTFLLYILSESPDRISRGFPEILGNDSSPFPGAVLPQCLILPSEIPRACHRSPFPLTCQVPSAPPAAYTFRKPCQYPDARPERTAPSRFHRPPVPPSP